MEFKFEDFLNHEFAIHVNNQREIDTIRELYEEKTQMGAKRYEYVPNKINVSRMCMAFLSHMFLNDSTLFDYETVIVDFSKVKECREKLYE